MLRGNFFSAECVYACHLMRLLSSKLRTDKKEVLLYLHNSFVEYTATECGPGPVVTVDGFVETKS